MFTSARAARHLLGFLALGLLAACSGRTGAPTTPPLGTSQAAQSLHTLASATATTPTETLFVYSNYVGLPSTVSLYASPSYNTLTPTTIGVNVVVNALAVDAANDIFVAGDSTTQSPRPGDLQVVQVFAPPYTEKPTTIISNPTHIYGLALNAAGDLFVDVNNTITEYAPPFTALSTPIATIPARSGIFAMDAAGDIFAPGAAGTAGTSSIVKSSPPYTTWTTIVPNTGGAVGNGVNSLAVDAAGNVFVPSPNGSSTEITEYSAASSYATPTSIGSTNYGAVSLAVDGAGNIFAENNNTATEYKPPYTTQPTIINGVAFEGGLLAVTPSAPTSCTITSTPIVTVPGRPNTQTIGVGEIVDLTANVPVNWAVQPVSGAGSVTKAGFFTAPYAAGTSTVTATPKNGSASCSITFTILQPNGLAFYWLTEPGYGYNIHKDAAGFFKYTASMVVAVFLTPGNVSFHKIQIHELDGSTQISLPLHLTNLARINSPNAWFVNCDKNDYGYYLGSGTGGQLIDNPYWAFEWQDATGTHQTKFSRTHKEMSSSNGYFTISKGQTEALQDGTWVDTPNAITANRNILQSSPASVLQNVTLAECPGIVQGQFGNFLN